MSLTPEQFHLIAGVMYEPLSYIHADYQTVATKEDNILWQKITNLTLIKQYQLTLELDCPLDDITQKLFTNWSLLPRCALFLGYFYSPSALLLSANYYQLEPSLLAFLSLSPLIKDGREDEKRVLQDMAPLEIGYSLLFNFIASISTALSQRFVLLFSPKISKLNLPFTLRLSHSLFLLVLNYAAITA